MAQIIVMSMKKLFSTLVLISLMLIVFRSMNHFRVFIHVFYFLQGLQKKTNKQVAIKIFSHDVLAAMKQEADMMARAKHVNVVEFITLECDVNNNILVMELCDGTLHASIGRNGLKRPDFLRLCEDLSSAIICGIEILRPKISCTQTSIAKSSIN